MTYGIDNDYLFDISEVVFSYDPETYSNEDNLQLWKCDDYSLSSRVCAGTWMDVTASSEKNVAGNYFTYNTTTFSGFAIKEYVAVVPTSSGGGSGGGCAEGGSGG